MTTLDDLYGLPLDRFTPERDALAKRLREDGDREGAKEVKKLKKPSLPAWAVNQVVRADRAAIERLFELRARIESASSSSEMREASEQRRHLIADLVARAEQVLTDAGRAGGAGATQAITQTFHAGDTDEDRDALLNGRLVRELTPGGFGGFALAPVETTDDDAADPKLEEKRRRAEELEEEADAAEAEAERLEEELAAAERAVERAKARAEAARRSATQTRQHADRARAEADRAG